MTDPYYREQLEISPTLELRVLYAESPDQILELIRTTEDGFHLRILGLTTHETGALVEQFDRILSELASRGRE